MKSRLSETSLRQMRIIINGLRTICSESIANIHFFSHFATFFLLCGATDRSSIENGLVGQGGRVGEGIKKQRSDRDGALTRVCMPKCD